MEYTRDMMDQIHRCGQEILDEFVDICRENHLQYCLAFGTLLGAVRHNGPVPWDDDVDVYMPRADAEKFKTLMLARPENELYHIHCYKNDPAFAFHFYRLNKSGTVFKTKTAIETNRRYMEMWIDILPLDEWRWGHPEHWEGKLLARLILCCKDESMVRRKIVRKKLSVKRRILQLALKPLSDERLYALTEWLMQTAGGGKNCGYYADWTSRSQARFPKNIIPKQWFGQLCQVSYLGSEYKAPSEWDKLLTQIYGDYMQPPPEDKRGGHGPLEVRI